MPHMLHGCFVTDSMALTTLVGPNKLILINVLSSQTVNSNVKMQPALGHRGTAYRSSGTYSPFLIPFHAGRFREMLAHSVRSHFSVAATCHTKSTCRSNSVVLYAVSDLVPRTLGSKLRRQDSDEARSAVSILTRAPVRFILALPVDRRVCPYSRPSREYPCFDEAGIAGVDGCTGPPGSINSSIPQQCSILNNANFWCVYGSWRP
ncbi:hypothetical protein C8R43DRAFT_607659 [Mycena crocata]|nr:hypothetical protein C8R43DRAFT_607659 [Mycena crocata]